MLAAKSFEAISDMTAVERWIMILAEELSERMIADNKLFNRRPRSLHLHYRYNACLHYRFVSMLPHYVRQIVKLA